MISTQLPLSASIERRHQPSYSEFAQEFLYPYKPVVITGALERWTALSRWTPQFFKETFGSAPIKTDGQKYTLGGYFPLKDDGQPYTMAEFIDLVVASNDEHPAPYLRNVHLEKFLPELCADVNPMPEYLSPNWLEGPLTQLLDSRLNRGRWELFIGGKGARFPMLHYDTWHIHTFIAQIYGVKEYIFFAPCQSTYLYAKGNSSQISDPQNVDFVKFPLYASAIPIHFELRPGDMLFVPAGWWHTTRILTPSITVAASRVNQSNWKIFSHDMRDKAPLPLRPLVATYLTAIRVARTFAGL
jgi:histone arginine demethylase JMJD6